MRVCPVENKVHAHKTADLLTEHGIPCRIVPLEDYLLSGFWRKELVWGYIEVPEEFAEAAKKIL